MAQTAKQRRYMTVAEYLRFEERSKYKHEYMDGEVFRLHSDSPRDAQLAGNRVSHVFIVSNICFYLRLALRDKKKDCLVGATEMRVLLRDDHYAYPDVFAVCGDLSLVPNVFDTLTNPVVLFEVLSKSTELRDRGDKAHDYRKMPSVTDYVLITQDKMRVEQQARQSEGGWKIVIYDDADDTINFDSLECAIKLKDIYENIEFPPKPNLRLVETKKRKS
jgi:Uma2 family endonuclease